jgi:hypothetical protein
VRAVPVVAAAAVLWVTSACGTVDDVARVADDAARAADDVIQAGDNPSVLDDATRAGDDILREVPVMPVPATVVATRMQTLIDTAPPEVREAFASLVWDVGCDIVAGNLPDDTDALADYLLERAVAFGIQFFEEAERDVAEAVLDAVSADANEAAQRCQQLPDSGP